jgi:hypothetical protein
MGSRRISSFPVPFASDDPVNLVLAGTLEQLRAAFATAGWSEAEGRSFEVVNQVLISSHRDGPGRYVGLLAMLLDRSSRDARPHRLERQPVVRQRLGLIERPLPPTGQGSGELVPTWMTEAEASSVKIIDAPCLSLARLLELRAFVDSVLASQTGKAIPDEGGVDGDSWDIPATGSVRDSAADGARPGRADQLGGSAADASVGGDGGAESRRPGSIGGGR